jgi:streptogramin lyase
MISVNKTSETHGVSQGRLKGVNMAPPPGTRWIGVLLFTSFVANFSGIASGQVITEFPIPTAGSFPFRIASGSDGNLWFTEFFGNQIGRITTAGVITEFTATATPTPTSTSVPPTATQTAVVRATGGRIA